MIKLSKNLKARKSLQKLIVEFKLFFLVHNECQCILIFILHRSNIFYLVISKNGFSTKVKEIKKNETFNLILVFVYLQGHSGLVLPINLEIIVWFGRYKGVPAIYSVLSVLEPSQLN